LYSPCGRKGRCHVERSKEISINLIGISVVVGILSFCCSSLWARTTTAQEARDLVVGWLKADPNPLGTSLGQRIKWVETFTNQYNESIYHIVYLEPAGFVVVSAEDLIEPIIAFGRGDGFNPSTENPLGALVTKDLTSRMASFRDSFEVLTAHNHPTFSENQHKWRHFIDLANTPKGKNAISLLSVGVDSISEVRVPPLVKSKWGQYSISSLWNGGYRVGEDCPVPCYNYYTPNNYLCGCPATALAQLMRYYEYPTNGIGVHEFTITIGWPTGPAQQVFTRGGDGLGGPYNWDLMPYEPNCDSTELQRQAIGALCYDAGVSMNQTYSKNASGWRGCTNTRMINALKTTFMYGNAVHGFSGGSSPIGEGLIGMVNPNLDAKKPVILGTVEHAFVCDGYGYNDSTLYHHLNMGWLGLDDLWYDLRTSIVPVDGPSIGTVCSCVYNVQTLRGGDGEIISGRVLDHNDEPLANAVIYATSMGEFIAETETDDKGIYAFDCLESNTTYTINAALREYGFSRQTVTTGISQDNSVISGNLWGVDLAGLFCDFNSDQKVDVKDMIMLVEHWGQDYPDFDVAPSPSGDGIIDVRDLIVLAEYLFEEVQDPTLIAHWPLDEIQGMVVGDTVGDNQAFAVGDPIWQPDGGQVGGALLFDGVDDFISAPMPLNPADGPFSVFVWINGGAPGQVIAAQQTVSNWISLDAEGNLMTDINCVGSSAAPLVSEAVMTDGQWHRVGLVWDGSSRRLIVDDIVVAEDMQTTLESSDRGLYIGVGKEFSADSFFSGLIDDIRIYNRATHP